MFLGLTSKFDDIDYYHYLQGLRYFQIPGNTGITLINSNTLLNTEDSFLITGEKALEFVNINFSDKLGILSSSFSYYFIYVCYLDKDGLSKLQTDIRMSSMGIIIFKKWIN